MTKLMFFAPLMSLLAGIACTSPTPASGGESPTKQLTLSLARAVVHKGVPAPEIKRLLGSPDLVKPIDGRNFDAWVYMWKDRPDVGRLYVYVLRDSNSVKSATWNVFEEDPESNLENAEKAVGNPVFKKSEPKWTKGDAAPDEVFFISEEAGVTISLRKTLNQVDSILWQ